jgi:N-dimethylarginine dimethylaminohydrolase
LIGRGYRTNAAGIDQMRALLAPRGVTVIESTLPHGPGPGFCLHLMSLISILDERVALVDLPWLSVPTVELLQRMSYTLIEIDPSERDSMACNVLALGNRRLIAIDENAGTNDILRDHGFDVRTFHAGEISLNGGGGPTCLTRPILRG